MRLLAHPLRKLTLVVGVLVLAAAPAPAADSSQRTRPNVVFVVADDLGWRDLGSFGSDYYETPNIDRLRRQGLKFTAAYTNGPNCAPIRACLLTGRYQPRHGIYTVGSGARGKAKFRNMIPAKNNTRLAPEEITFGEIAQKAGYATAHMGKWHMGTGKHSPENQGFALNIAGNQAGHPRSYFSPYKNPDIEDGPKGEYLTDRLTAEAVNFMEAHKEEPFFLYLPYYAVHTPLQAPQDRIARFQQKDPAGEHDNPTYAAMVASLDRGIGRILEKLNSLNLREETLVIFYSDNGGVGGYADAGIEGGKEITDNSPLHGGKGMLYEGGIRVPMIVRWPGVVEPGSICDEPVISIDFLPTFVEILGERLPTDRPIDGTSFLPLLKDPEAELDREALYWHFPGYLQASSRKGTWRTTPAAAVRAGNWKLIEFFATGKRELYNLNEDVGEQRDLSEKMPQKVEQLHGKMLRWRQRTNAPMPKPKSGS